MARTSAPLVAIVDDEKNIQETVSYALKKEGFKTICFSNGQEAWQHFQHKMPDLAILDILMPLMDGLTLLRHLRAAHEALPIIFLTSKDEEIDRILGLEMGADDYICKPFSIRELVTRVKVLFRRLAHSRQNHQGKKDLLQLGELELDLLCYTARWKGQKLHLTITEFMLLHALARQPGVVKTRDKLMEEAYPDNTYVSDRTIDSHIKRLRKKFMDLDSGFALIETVYGLGYRFKGD